MKDLCAKYGIPTAAYGRFTDAAKAKAFIRARGAPIVVKADGLAAGKGVIVAATVAEAEAAVDAMLTGRQFGAAGAEVVVEEFLDGEEASFFALTDGATRAAARLRAGPQARRRRRHRPQHRRHGRLFAGAGRDRRRWRPTSWRASSSRPSRAMAAEGRPFKGVLYAGLMLTKDGPKLLEYNVRFGDPECQVLCVRLMSDLLPALIAAARRRARAASTCAGTTRRRSRVVMAAKGYPDAYAEGHGDPRPGAGGGAAGRDGLPRRHQARRGRPHPRQWRARAERDGDGQDDRARRSSAPTRRST